MLRNKKKMVPSCKHFLHKCVNEMMDYASSTDYYPITQGLTSLDCYYSNLMMLQT